MDTSSTSPEMLALLPCPAFIVEKGVILQANRAAEQRQLCVGTSISEYIALGAEEYANFTSGELFLTLNVCGATHNATVTNYGENHMFYLEPDYQDPELRAFALAAQQLREPLAKAMTCASCLPSDKKLENHLSQLNKNLYQLHRALCNMSDAAQYEKVRPTRMEYREVGSIFSEVMEKAAQLIAKGSHKLTYCGPTKAVSTMVDAEKLERALLNMISNAAKFTPKGGEIHASLRVSGKKLYFCVENATSAPKQAKNMFAHYLREPGIEGPENGIGLGMSIIRKAAAAHSGTLLMEQLENECLRFTMTINLEVPKSTRLRNKVQLAVDYAGGYDHTLTELSDILPPELYK